jgi:hypothetical protein
LEIKMNHIDYQYYTNRNTAFYWFIGQ